MSLFLCDKCGVIENTAISPYWVKDDVCDGKALCSECSPEIEGYSKGGKWHGQFPREFMTDEQIVEKTDWSGWVYCERLKDVLSAYGERIRTERAERDELRRKSQEGTYPARIQVMRNSTKAQRRAKKAAKRRFLEATA